MKIHEETFTAYGGCTARPGQLFFDIESTGLSPRSASVYLIGCSWFDRDKWRLKLFFASDRAEEAEVLLAFSQLVKDFDTLVHFNGERFDIPFVRERCARHCLSDPFTKKKSIDLLKLVRPYKKLLGLPNLRQKTLEAYLGLERKDMFNGGELIRVYEEYLRNKEERLKRFLLLHNLEDVKGMSALTALLDIPDWLHSNFEYLGAEYLPTPSENCAAGSTVTLRFRSQKPFPAHIFVSGKSESLTAAGYETALTLPVFSGNVKLFYPNVKDYYYLIEEGYAIHKDVAAYVKSCRRKRATLETCFGYCAPEKLGDTETATLLVRGYVKRFMKR